MPETNSRRGRRCGGVGLLVICGLVSLHGLAVRQAHAQPQATVRVAPASVGAGMTGAVDVEVLGASELYGADIQLRFDPDVLEVVDVEPETEGIQFQLGRFLDTGMLVRNIANNEAGTVWYALTQLNPSEPRSGDGVLFSVIVRGLAAEQETRIEVTSATIVTRTGLKMPVHTADGEVRIVPRSEAPPAPTKAPAVVATLVVEDLAAAPSTENDDQSPSDNPPASDAALAESPGTPVAAEPDAPDSAAPATAETPISEFMSMRRWLLLLVALVVLLTFGWGWREAR